LFGNKPLNYKHSSNHSYNNLNNHFNNRIFKDLADGEAKKRVITLTRIGQRMVIQKGLLLKIREIIQSEMIGKNKDVLDIVRKVTLSETA